MNTLAQRITAIVRRVFFWLPGGSPSEEQTPKHTHDHALIVAVTAPRRIPTYRQLRYAGRVLSTRERRTLTLAILGTVLSVGAALGLLINERTIRIPAPGGLLIEALIGEPMYINPLDAPANDVDRDLTSLIYSGLFRMDGMNPVPDMAERYEWSADRKTLTVTLRSDARFHTGEPVSADDVQFTIDQIQHPKRLSPLAPSFRGVTTIALDEHTVQFNLSQPDIHLLAALTVGILPARLWQDIPVTNARLADLNLKPVGSGPYAFKSFTRDNRGLIRSFTLERFNGYYGVKPYIENITFQFFIDRNQAQDALKGDVVDALAFANLGEKAGSASNRWNTVHLELPQETVAFFNTKNTVLSDVRVRHALSAAIDRQEVAAIWKDGAQPISSPLPFTSTTPTTLSIEQARTDLEEAGWVMPSNGDIRIFTPKPKTTTKTNTKTKTPPPAPAIPEKNASSTELALTIATLNQPELIAAAEVLQRRWSLLGAHVVIEPMESVELIRKATRDRNPSVVLTNILLDPTQDLFPFWWSGQASDRGLNISNLSDRDVDNALIAIRNASSTQALEDARTQAATFISRSTPAAFLVRPSALYLVSNKVRGVSSRAVASQPADRFHDLMNWYIETDWKWK